MNTLQKEINRLQTSARPKGFIERNFSLKTVMIFVIYPCAAVLSMLTAGVHLHLTLSDVLKQPQLVFALTMLLMFFVEVAQYFFLNGVVDDVREGVFAESINHVAAWLLKLAGAALFVFLSVSLSVQGAPKAAEHYKKQRNPVALVSVDSIQTAYNAKIAPYQKQVDQGASIKYKGIIVPAGQKIINKAQAQLDRLETERQSAISSALAENEKRQTDYDGKLQDSGTWFQRIAGLGEIIKFIALIFLANYEAGSRRELKLGPIATGEAVLMPQTDAAPQYRTNPATQYTPTPAPIGFTRKDTDHPEVYTPPTPKEQLKPVATTSHELQTLLAAYKNAKSNLDAWKAKPDTWKSKPANLQKWSGTMAELAEKIRQAGGNV